jgi:hypothetical protein
LYVGKSPNGSSSMRGMSQIGGDLQIRFVNQACISPASFEGVFRETGANH